MSLIFFATTSYEINTILEKKSPDLISLVEVSTWITTQLTLAEVLYILVNRVQLTRQLAGENIGCPLQE